MNAYKIRLQIKSKVKGKIGGARVISLLEIQMLSLVDVTEGTTTVHLVTIYDKAEIASLTDKELKSLLSSVNNE